MKMNKHGYFITQEFISEDIYNYLGDDSILYMDNNIISTANALRGLFGPTYINTYAFGGKSNYRGFRAPLMRSNPITGVKFAKLSMHRFGKGLDLVFKLITAEEVRQYIINNRYLFPHIHRMEKDVSCDTTHR